MEVWFNQLYVVPAMHLINVTRTDLCFVHSGVGRS